MKKIPKPVRNMLVRAVSHTAAGKLARKVSSGAARKGGRTADFGSAASKTGSAILRAAFPEKPGRVKLQAIHGSKYSAFDRLADLGLTAAVTAPIARAKKRKRRADIAGTAAVGLAKVILRVKWR